MKEIKINYDKLDDMAKHLESPFGNANNYKKTAYLNWVIQKDRPIENLKKMADTYFNSAELLLDQCLSDNSDKKADKLIFPILFDIVHGIELYLKSIDSILNIILNRKKTKKLNHKIDVIVKNIIKNLARVKAIKCDSFNDEEIDRILCAMNIVKNFISNIYTKTSDMSFARYPFSTDFKNMFYNSTYENETINMEILYEQLEYVKTMFEFTYDSLDNLLHPSNY